MISPRDTQNTKETLIAEARKYADESKHTERLQAWKQILEVELSDDERIEARVAARSLDMLLTQEEYEKLSSEDVVNHTALAISVIGKLIQIVPRRETQRRLKDRKTHLEKILKKCELLSLTGKYGKDGKYTECLRVWRQILDLNVELSNDQRIEACDAAWPIDELLPEEEYSNLSSEVIVTHSELAISVLDSLIQTEKDAKRIEQLLVWRWNNDGELMLKGKGLGSSKKMHEFYVKKAREAYAPFLPAHPQRIKDILDFIRRLENNERMQMEELRKLKEEVEAAREDLERMTKEERLESEQWLSAVKKHLENIPKKNELKKRAKEEGKTERFTERLRMWKQIVELNLELSYEERTELRKACQPLEELRTVGWTIVKGICDHSELAMSTIELYVRQALFYYDGERSELFSLLWENEKILSKSGKLSSTVNKRTLRVIQLIKESFEKEGISADNAERISLCSHFFGKMEDGREKLVELKKLVDEVGEVWKIHPTWKDAASLDELSKVKAEMERLSKSL